jgi:hypothetical protein
MWVTPRVWGIGVVLIILQNLEFTLSENENNWGISLWWSLAAEGKITDERCVSLENLGFDCRIVILTYFLMKGMSGLRDLNRLNGGREGLVEGA